LERRRLAAANLFAQGVSAAVVALRLGVSRQSAHRWYRAWRAGEVQALRARGPIGRHRRLLPTQLDQVEHALLEGELVPTGSLATCGRWSVSPR
jgi:transposase